MTDTIFARVTGAGRAAVAVLRLSGPSSRTIVEELAGSLPPARAAGVRTLRDAGREVLDQALVLWIPGPASFTGEDCAELQVHGGPAVVDAVSRALLEAGARPADAGEFSRRAFENGKLDLLQAEAVADLVDAQSDAQRRQALGQLNGTASGRYLDWRGKIIEALALVEAELDFPDEDLPGAVSRQAAKPLEDLLFELETELRSAVRGRNVREGYRIALIGKVNAGKSSLFNRLIGRDAAIVSARAGTTRDVVEARSSFAGFEVALADTAGMRTTGDEIEAEGVRRAEAWAKNASLRLIVHDSSEEQALDPTVARLAQPGDLLVLGKSDLGVEPDQAVIGWAGEQQVDLVRASSATSDGLEELTSFLFNRVQSDMTLSEQPVVTRERHQLALEQAVMRLKAGVAALYEAPERAAEDIRAAALSLASVVGSVDRESVLDQVFSSFCIGK